MMYIPLTFSCIAQKKKKEKKKEEKKEESHVIHVHRVKVSLSLNEENNYCLASFGKRIKNNFEYLVNIYYFLI
jgi:hypothetical protein